MSSSDIYALRSKGYVFADGAEIGDAKTFAKQKANAKEVANAVASLKKEKYVWADTVSGLGSIMSTDQLKAAQDKVYSVAKTRRLTKTTWSCGSNMRIGGQTTYSGLKSSISTRQRMIASADNTYRKAGSTWQRKGTGTDVGKYKKVKLHSDKDAVADPYGSTKKRLEDVKHLRYNLNITYGDSGNNVTNYFDRLYSVYPQIEQDSFCQYVFLVRPSCNIYKGDGIKKLQNLTVAQMKSGLYGRSCPANDQFFRYMKANYNNILGQITADFSDDHDFMPYLVGRTESLQVPDYSIKSSTLDQPYTNLSLPYGLHTFESQTGGDFDIAFRDDNEFRLHKMFQAWLKYINYVTKNEFCPEMKYVRFNKLDYCTSVYNIICKADGKTIVAWTKYTGAFPTSVPSSDFSFSRGSGVSDGKMSIPFKYYFSEVMEPEILVDFNENSHIDNKNISSKKDWVEKHDMPIYDETDLNDYEFNFSSAKDVSKKIMKASAVNGTGNGLVGAPFIYKNSDGIYNLGWKRISTKSMW